MKVLLLGRGAALHALAWKAVSVPSVQMVHCTPGNAGTALLLGPAPFSPRETEIAQWAFAQQVDLVVVQRAPAWTDTLVGVGLPVLGIGEQGFQALRRRQASRERWQSRGLRCPAGASFRDLEAAERYLASRHLPLWIRPEDTTLQEVVRVEDRWTAFQQLEHFLTLDPEMGVCIEEEVPGIELGLALLTDGQRALALGLSRPYDHRHEGDRGPLTEGMGGYLPYGGRDLEERLLAEVGRPVIEALGVAGLLRPAFLHLRIILGPQGPVLREVSWDLDDLHAALFLSCCGGEVIDLLHMAVQGRLEEASPLRLEGVAVGVAMVVEAYPGPCPQGLSLRGSYDAPALVFHHATCLQADFPVIPAETLPAWLRPASSRPLPLTRRVVTSGGRVLLAVGVAESGALARRRAYQAVAQLEFEHCDWRGDIAAELEAGTADGF